MGGTITVSSHPTTTLTLDPVAESVTSEQALVQRWIDEGDAGLS
jgi:hypothetical protein